MISICSKTNFKKLLRLELYVKLIIARTTNSVQVSMTTATIILRLKLLALFVLIVFLVVLTRVPLLINYCLLLDFILKKLIN